MIWIDLDETLVSSTEFASEKGTRTRVKFRGRPLWSSCRPGAVELLGALRRLGKVRMLTTAIRPYAYAANVEFGFGFSRRQIVARMQWMENGVNQVSGVDPKGILIDNASGQECHHFKCSYLGIGQERVLLVPDYLGALPDVLEKDWPDLVEKAQEILNR